MECALTGQVVLQGGESSRGRPVLVSPSRDQCVLRSLRLGMPLPTSRMLRKRSSDTVPSSSFSAIIGITRVLRPPPPTQVQDHQTLMGLFATLAGRLTQLQTLQGGEPAKVIQQTADLLSGATASQANIQNGITAYGLQQMQHQPAVPNQVNFPTQTIVRRESDDAVSAPPSPSETASSASSVAAGVPRGPG